MEGIKELLKITAEEISKKEKQTHLQDLNGEQYYKKFVGPKFEFTPDVFIRLDKAEEKGYSFEAESIVPPIQCKFCGEKLYPYYLNNGLYKKQLSLCLGIERCNCRQSQKFFQEIDNQKEQEEKELECRKENFELSKKIERLKLHSGMGERFKNRTFKNFKIYNVGTKKAYEVVKKYADSFQEDLLPHRKTSYSEIQPPKELVNCLFITGSYGTGKTHLACAVANQLISEGTQVICMTMIEMLNRIKQTFDNPYFEGTEKDILDVYEKVPLLIIDDLGSEQITEWSSSKIFSIINARYESYMPMIITTNYGVAELIQRLVPYDKINGYGDRKNAEKTIDRLQETSVGLDMIWESYRGRE